MHMFGEALLAIMAIMTMYDSTGWIYSSSRVNSTAYTSIPSFSTLSGYSYTGFITCSPNGTYRNTGHRAANCAFSAPTVSPSLNRISIPLNYPFHSTPFPASTLYWRGITGTMVRALSKFPKKPANWVPPTAPLTERKQVFLYVYLSQERNSNEMPGSERN